MSGELETKEILAHREAPTFPSREMTWALSMGVMRGAI